MRFPVWFLAVVLLFTVAACEKQKTPPAPADEPKAGAVTPPPAPATPGEPVAPAAPAPTLKPEELPALTAKQDRGLPDGVSPEVLAAARRVLTDPGDLPQLEVTVGEEKRALPLKHTHVSAEISGFVARVEVTQTYRNPLAKPIEAVYVFPLPENSAVDDMKIRIGERLIEAEIQRREDARRTYETARREGYTAALLEQERPNVFTQSIANMEPGKDIEVIIRYVQDLTYDAGEYEFVFPMVVGPRYIPGSPVEGKSGTGWSPDTDAVPDASRITPPIVGGGKRPGHDISIEVVIAPGLPVADFAVPTHAVEANQVDGAMVVELARKDSLPNRDFVLRFRADRPLPQGAVFAHQKKRGGFFSLVVQPPTLDVDELLGRRELIFVIDVSGSMSGRPLSMAKDAAREAIRKLRPVDTFNVITFAGQTAKAFPAPRPANTSNIREAVGFVDEATAGGGTYLANAVEAALSPEIHDGRNRFVVFLTDGYVGNEAQIHTMVRELVKSFREKGQRARAFGFGIGSSTNRHLLDGIGQAGDGAAVYLTTREDPQRAVQKAFRMIDHPVLTDVRIDWGSLEVKDTYPEQLPDLLASRPLIVHGRYEGSGSATVTVSGEAEGKRIEVPITVTLPEHEAKNGVLETLWARSRIESLQRRLWDGPDPTVVETITALGLDYRLVTAYTSFVAVDRSKKVGDGDPEKIVQPVAAPEGVDLTMAAPPAAMAYGGGSMAPKMKMSVGKGGLGRSRPHTSRPAAVRLQAMEVASSPPPVAAAPAPEPSEPTTEETADEAASATEKPRDSAHEKPGAKLRAKVILVEVKSGGTYDEAALGRRIRSRVGAFRACYERRLKETPTLTGTIELRWVIDAQGRVTPVQIVSDGVGDPELARCLKMRLRTLRFPAPGDGPVTVRVTLTFSLS